MTQTLPPAPAPPPHAARPRRLRWLWRSLAGVAALLLLIIIVVQIVLWTDLPRNLVVGQIEKQLGLKLTVKSLSVDWFGHTDLSDVTIGLPLAEHAFFGAPAMKVKNTWLIGILLGRPIEVQAIELDQPHLYVLQDAAGRWNVQDVAELLLRAGGKQAGAQSAQTSSTPSLPNVHLADGIVTLIDNQKHTVDIAPLAVDGYHDSALSWKYDIHIPPRVDISGRLVPGGNWGHDAAIQLSDVTAWIRPFVPVAPAISLNANWSGAVGTAGVGGRLEIHSISVASPTHELLATGALSAGFNGGQITIRPENLQIQTPGGNLPPLTLDSGTIAYDPGGADVKATRMLMNALGGPVVIDADFSLATLSATLKAGWNELVLPGKITHGGSVWLNIKHPYPNQITLSGELHSTGRTPSGPWEIASSFEASGPSVQNFDWSVSIPTMQWKTKPQAVTLDGLTLRGAMRPDAVSISSLALANPDFLSGSARYAFGQTQGWTAQLRGQHWPFHPIAGTELAFDLLAHGEMVASATAGASKPTEVITLDRLVLKSPDVRVTSKGTYTFGQPKPLAADVVLTNAPPNQAPAAVAATPQAKILNGTVDGHFSLAGTVDPLQLGIRGNLTGREIDVRGHHVGELELKLSDQSHVDGDGVFVYTQSLALLGGQWGIDGIYLFDKYGLDVDVDLNHLSVGDAAQLADVKDISGSVDGQIKVFVPGLHPSLDTLQVPPAVVKVHDLKAMGIGISEIAATLSLEDGNLRLDPIALKQGHGVGAVSIAARVDNLRQVDLDVSFDQWPIDIGGGLLHTDATLRIPRAVIELPNPGSADPTVRVLRIDAGQINLTGQALLQGDVLGEFQMFAGLDGREVDVRAVHVKLLGGRLDGQAHANLDEPLRATAEFTWQDLDLQNLGAVFPRMKQLRDLRGTLSGDARLGPATVPRPREPMALVITNTFSNGSWRHVPIVDARIAAYLGPNTEVPDGGWRIVLEDNKVIPSFIHFDGGTVELWGRFGTHGQSSSSQAQLTFRDLDLNALIHAIEPQATYLPGRVAGSVMLIRAPVPPAAPHTLAPMRMFPAPPPVAVPPATSPADEPPIEAIVNPIYAEGTVKITHANLARFGPFAFLYNAANLFHDPNTFEGIGNADFHLENSSLSIQHLRYFNRGTEIRAVAKVDRVWDLPDSPLLATAFLTARPLRQVTLPVLADFDTVLQAVQASLKLTAVRVVGTVHKYQIIGPLGITDMGAELQQFLVGDAKGELDAQGVY